MSEDPYDEIERMLASLFGQQVATNAVVDVILVIQDSDSDGFFTNYAKELGKELIVVKDALGIGAKLAEMK